MCKEHLVLPRQEFLAALDLLRRTATRFENDEVVVRFDDECLHLELGGATVTVPALGRFEGQFTMLADLMFYWLKAPPPGDPIVFTFEHNRLIFGRHSTMVKRQPARSKSLDIPLDLTKFDLVILYAIYSEQELQSAGLLSSAKIAFSELLEALEKSRAPLKKFGMNLDDVLNCLMDGFKCQYNVRKKVE